MRCARRWCLIGGFCLLSLVCAAEEAGAPADSCLETYRREFRDYFQLSGLVATYIGHASGSANRDVEGTHGPVQVSGFSGTTGFLIGSELKIIELLFGVAYEKAFACWVMGGRVWEIDVGEGSPRRGTLCAPGVCTKEEVETQIVLHAVEREVITEYSATTRAYELSHWQHLKLDFAIIGASHCGSTSLHLNLAQHPKLQFSTVHEDGFFAPGGSPQMYVEYKGKRILPYAADVAEFNARWDGKSLMGINNPDIYDYDLGLLALAEVPKVKVVMILCDPVGRLEKTFFNQFCKMSADCPLSLENVPSKFLRGLNVGPHLPKVRAIFKERLFLMHQAALRHSPREAFDSVAEFLGVGPMPETVTFHRYNAQRGQRTKLCSNATLLAMMKRRLASEYRAFAAAFAAAGTPIPEEVLRRTRCDYPEDIRDDAESCHYRGRCSS